MFKQLDYSVFPRDVVLKVFQNMPDTIMLEGIQMPWFSGKKLKPKNASEWHEFYDWSTVQETDLINVHRWTAKTILKFENAEQRRVALQVFGINRFLLEGGAHVVMEPLNDKDYQNAKIHEINIDNLKMYYIELINQSIEPQHRNLSVAERLAHGLMPTGQKRYFLGCLAPENYTSILDAWKWTFKFGRHGIVCDISQYDTLDLDTAVNHVLDNPNLNNTEKSDMCYSLFNREAEKLFPDIEA